ncbi:hypothetical protein TUBRATIS_009390 [Tubulinosema ratisbonensis]|uniref:Uncharacterized protein n=1 Tax=Tubulinosema ratisbonensis TaxID=291195 RepID=A0A437ANH1_9MICR|nr:hypothetical protein TUBRATIS_009390 [Tubulinosema ratisbonensis]
MIKQAIKLKLEKYFLILNIFLNFFSIFIPVIVSFSIFDTIIYDYWIILMNLILFILYTCCNLLKRNSNLSLSTDIIWVLCFFIFIIVEQICYTFGGAFMIYKQNINLFIVSSGLYLIFGMSLLVINYFQRKQKYYFSLLDSLLVFCIKNCYLIYFNIKLNKF